MPGRSTALCLAVTAFALVAILPLPATAAPGIVGKAEASGSMVGKAGYYKRRWRYRDGTYVRAPFTDVEDSAAGTWVGAPFARVYSGRRGTWVRAPFVDLWVPRD